VLHQLFTLRISEIAPLSRFVTVRLHDFTRESRDEAFREHRSSRSGRGLSSAALAAINVLDQHKPWTQGGGGRASGACELS
jgi:hypothetical protein